MKIACETQLIRQKQRIRGGRKGKRKFMNIIRLIFAFYFSHLGENIMEFIQSLAAEVRENWVHIGLFVNS